MTYKDLKTENEKLKESLQKQLLGNLTLLDEIRKLNLEKTDLLNKNKSLAGADALPLNMLQAQNEVIKNLKELDNKDIRKLQKEIKRKNRIISYLESKCLKAFK